MWDQSKLVLLIHLSVSRQKLNLWSNWQRRQNTLDWSINRKKTTLESILFLFFEEAESWDDNVSEEDQDEINF